MLFPSSQRQELLELIHRPGGATNQQIDLQNPDNLRPQATDNGVVPNLKWSFSDSHQRLFDGGWVRQQIVTDLPISVDFSAGQVHLKKGSSRELHWHRAVFTSCSLDFK